MSDSATPETAAHESPPSLGFSRQELWSGLPFPSPMHESENWKSCPTQQPHGLQSTRILHPWVSQARVLEWGAIAFSMIIFYFLLFCLSGFWGCQFPFLRYFLLWDNKETFVWYSNYYFYKYRKELKPHTFSQPQIYQSALEIVKFYWLKLIN